jgi:hypothetical protein
MITDRMLKMFKRKPQVKSDANRELAAKEKGQLKP